VTTNNTHLLPTAIIVGLRKKCFTFTATKGSHLAAIGNFFVKENVTDL